jgi:Sec-independent protein translocase protein TatA
LLGILILFGPEKLPDILKTIRSGASKLDEAKKEIQKEINSFTTEIKKNIDIDIKK